MEDKNKNKKTDSLVPTGMLSSPHITYCIDKYQIIKDHDLSCIDSASYQMRVGGNVLTWHQGTKIEFELGEKEDKNLNIRKSVELLPNSLTFLTTIEEFQLTKDIIARFNLKSKWVHQGLLLGTGPIVDPQLHARLLIPVHNFSNQTVTMNYKQQFISVEFTKTLDPDSELPLKSGNKTKYIENPNWSFDFFGYRERIENKVVVSSVQSKFEESKEQIELYGKEIKEFQGTVKKEISRFMTINIISVAAAVLTIFGLILSTSILIKQTHDKADAAYNLVKQYKENSVDFRSFALKSSYDDLRKEISDLEIKIVRLNNEDISKAKKDVDELKVIQDRYKEKMKVMALRIEELEKKLKNKRKRENK